MPLTFLIKMVNYFPLSRNYNNMFFLYACNFSYKRNILSKEYQTNTYVFLSVSPLCLNTSPLRKPAYQCLSLQIDELRNKFRK